MTIMLMRELEIQEILTHGKHFTKEGFTILFP
jgi:predicted nucleic acid-binding protein